MMLLASISFETSTLTLLLSVLALVVVAALSLTTIHRSYYRRPIILLEMIRIAIVAMVVTVLNQPELWQQFIPAEKPTVAVLWDDSGSMQTKDVPATGSATGTLVSRQEAILELTRSATWKQAAEKFNVVFEPFSSAAAQASSGTDIASALEEASNKHGNLLAAVLISDGSWNRGKPPADLAADYRMKKRPIFTVCAGSGAALPDLEVSSLDAPTFAVIGKPTRVPYTIRSTLTQPVTVQAVLSSDDGQESTSEIEVPAGGLVNDALLWKPKKTGQFTLTLRIPPVDGEVSDSNNAISANISVRQESLRVLVIDTYPRWEYRFLRNALMRDPGVEVSCVLIHPQLPQRSEGKDYLTQVPDSIEELAKFDVIFLGDVGQEKGQLSVDDCERLRTVVRNHAVGLVFMPGIRGNQITLEQTALSELLPVAFDATQRMGIGSAMSCQLQLTEAGSASLLTKLADSPEANRSLWRNLPGFQWYAAVDRAKTGAQILAVHATESNRFGRIPLLVTKTHGLGKVLYMGTDGAWRWREGVEDKYHYRFWGQVVRWMAYQRKMAGGQSMRLFYSPDRPKTDSTLTLNANVMGNDGEPLQQGSVQVQLISPSGKSQVIKLPPAQEVDSWGLFSGKFTPLEAGVYQAKLSAQESSETIETTIEVQGAEREQIGKPADREAMSEIAAISRGQAFMLGEDTAVLFEKIAKLAQPAPQIKRTPLWAHPMMAAAFLLMVTTFWVGRKLAGVV